ncbi:hypothetical protein BJF79_44650 [Actinomadura sp. CNU-125]|nr:hypothetical protein BJF79_44650 [Actinomadura sp. CNU-125]
MAWTAWISRAIAMVSPSMTLSPCSGTLNSMPKSLRLIDVVAVKPARVPPHGSGLMPWNSVSSRTGRVTPLIVSSPSMW